MNNEIIELIDIIKEFIHENADLSFSKRRNWINRLEIIKKQLNVKEKNICLECYIENRQFVKNYKFPSFVETEKKICYICKKEKNCRVDD
jgi:hypothetical protein